MSERKKSKIFKLLKGSPVLVILLSLTLITGALLYGFSAIRTGRQTNDVQVTGYTPNFIPIIDGNSILDDTVITIPIDSMSSGGIVLGETEIFSHFVQIAPGYIHYANVEFDYSANLWLDDTEHEFYGLNLDILNADDEVITDTGLIIGVSHGETTFKTRYFLDPSFINTPNNAVVLLDVIFTENENDPAICNLMTLEVSTDRQIPMTEFIDNGFIVDENPLPGKNIFISATTTEPEALMTVQPQALFLSWNPPTWTGTIDINYVTQDELGLTANGIVTVTKI